MFPPLLSYSFIHLESFMVTVLCQKVQIPLHQRFVYQMISYSIKIVSEVFMYVNISHSRYLVHAKMHYVHVCVCTCARVKYTEAFHAYILIHKLTCTRTGMHFCH